MSKTLIAHEQSLTKIFSDDYVFSIPGYQRPYAWTTEQARELFDDLSGFMERDTGPIEEIPPYFLGSIVLIKAESSPMADVVDGQQRLTTLTILLAAIRASVGSVHSAEGKHASNRVPWSFSPSARPGIEHGEHEPISIEPQWRIQSHQ
jgi:uncharacterized protein with ParB-like and HNH nuclease domain